MMAGTAVTRKVGEVDAVTEDEEQDLSEYYDEMSQGFKVEPRLEMDMKKKLTTREEDQWSDEWCAKVAAMEFEVPTWWMQEVFSPLSTPSIGKIVDFFIAKPRMRNEELRQFSSDDRIFRMLLLLVLDSSM